jgi:2'-5' RNA ligase
MRVFYGIPLSGGLVDHFQALLRILEEQKVPKLQSTANLHLTLAFLGEVPVEKIPLLCQAGYEISQTHPQFRLRLGSLGCFGRTPKLTLWQGILASHPLQNLAHDLWLKLEGISYQKENGLIDPTSP